MGPLDPTTQFLWRQLVAAMVGPQRRLYGSVRTITDPSGTGTTVLAANRSNSTVLSVSVAVNANALVTFTRNQGSANPNSGFSRAMAVGSTEHFVLLPGDELYAATNPGTVFIVSESEF